MAATPKSRQQSVFERRPDSLKQFSDEFPKRRLGVASLSPEGMMLQLWLQLLQAGSTKIFDFWHLPANSLNMHYAPSETCPTHTHTFTLGQRQKQTQRQSSVALPNGT